MRNKKVNIIVIIAFMLIIGVSLYYVIAEPINLGLDLKGGTQIILKPVEGENSEVTDESLDKAMLIIRDRIDMLGVSEPLVTRDSSNNIIIQLPGVSDPDRALEVIGKTAQLEFRILNGTLISRTGQETEFIGFDPDTGELGYDGKPDEIILVDGINSNSPIKTESFTRIRKPETFLSWTGILFRRKVLLKTILLILTKKILVYPV